MPLSKTDFFSTLVVLLEICRCEPAKEDSTARSLTMKRRWAQRSLCIVALLLCSLRFLHLNADFPNHSRWGIDQAKYTDEGWWSNGAVMHRVLGHWNIPGDYNPAAAVPMWPLLLGVIFHFTDVNIFAARGLSVLLSIGTLGVVFLLVRRYAEVEPEMTGLLAVLLLAANPFAFVFSRLAILEPLVIFQFCLLMLVASYASERRVASLVLLALLIPCIVLTKTTAVLLLPAVVWILWTAMKEDVKAFVGSAVLVGVASVVAVKAYFALAIARGFGADYRYFFAVNQPEDIAWRRSLAVVDGILRDCSWIDLILYPLGVVMMVAATLWMRRLWRNPLFAASWIAFGCQAVFIFSRQEDYPPRYFLVMLVPLIISVVLAVGEMRLRYKAAYFAVMTVVVVSVAINIGEIVSFLHQRTYQLYDAATSINRIVRADAYENHLLLGVSASEISLMTGLPSINDAYGTEALDKKVLHYRPGWLLVWTGVGDEDRSALSAFQVDRISSYPVFDDDERNMLILYRIAPGVK